MRRAVAAALILLAVSAPGASGAIHSYVVAASGTTVPNGTIGGLVPYKSALLVAHGGVVYFAANVGGNEQWIYRWDAGKVTLVTQLARDIVGDDNGTIAWDQGANDKCEFSVLTAGASTPSRTGCGIGAVYLDYTVANGAVYSIGSVANPDNTNSGWGVYRNDALVAVVPKTSPVGVTNPPFVFSDGHDSIYLSGYSDAAVSKLVGGSFQPVLPGGNNVELAVSPGHILYGGPGAMFDLTASGTRALTPDFGSVTLGKSGDVVAHHPTNLRIYDKLERVEPDGPHPIVGVGSRTVDGWKVVGVTADFATPYDDDGTTAFFGAVEKHNVVKQALIAAIDECFVPKPVSGIPLDKQDRNDAGYEAAHTLGEFVSQVKQAIAKLKADTKRHPAHAQANAQAIHELERQLPAGGSFAVEARTRATDDKQDLVDNAKCSWLDNAAKTLQQVTEGGHAKEVHELGARMEDLKKVLNGTVKPGSPEAKKVLETNLVALGERFGGDNGGKLTSKALKLYNALTGQIAEKDLPKTVKGEIADLAKVLGGKNAGELATQITILVDVLRGDLDVDKQYEVLKASVSAVATRIGLEGLMKSPQARAAMLGFEIGKAFADRMSVDLQLVANRELKLACLNALADAQHVGHSWGEVDFAQKTAAFTPKLSSHPGWSCTIRPDTNVPGYDNHTLVEAYLPPKIVWGFKLYDEQDVWFDPAF